MPAKRNDDKAKSMFELYKKGFSLEQVGNAFGVTRQSVYKMFKKRNFKLRNSKKLPFIIFNGNKYTLRNTGYYGRTNKNRSLLHRDIWKSNHGKIPNGYDIHHIDGNKQNNHINNLEIIKKDTHSKIYTSRKNGNTDKTHCIRGHIFDEKNTYWYKGHRSCRKCINIRAKKYRQASATYSSK